jgi:hypothetical protein
VLAEPHDRRRKRFDVVVGLRPSIFQLFGDIGEEYRILSVDDGGDQLVAVGEPAVDRPASRRADLNRGKPTWRP